MGRSIPIQIQAELDKNAATTTLLMRVDPVTPGYSSYGVTTLDRDVVYDDLIGELTYSSSVGMQPSTLQATSDLQVDNADNVSLLPEFDIPISEADIAAGVYDFSRFTIYLVNFEDLTAGHHVVMAHGTLGRISIDNEGLSSVTELRGLSDQLKQSITERDSLSCRATYGSQPSGSATPGPIERFPCGRDATAELVDGTVDSVGLETNRTFTDASLTFGEDDLAPGIVVWVTGANAGRTYEVESNTDAGVVNLAHPTSFPIQIGDTFKIRPDCNKVARDVYKGCAAPHHWGSEWPLHFRGEPDIPVGDAGSNETPGAKLPPPVGPGFDVING